MTWNPLARKNERMARLRAILQGRDKDSLRNIGLLIFTVVTRLDRLFWLTANIIGLDENGILATHIQAVSPAAPGRSPSSRLVTPQPLSSARRSFC